jgi:hypothetical protein
MRIVGLFNREQNKENAGPQSKVAGFETQKDTMYAQNVTNPKRIKDHDK